MPNPTAAILIIGDEILTGRTREGNAHYLAGELAKAGIDLKEIRVVGDDHATIVAAVKALAGAHDHLFTSGGIGPTHDDITADAVAEAFGAGISVRDDARAILAAHYATRKMEFNEARLRMARIPDGAQLIENPVSAAPGFSIGNCHVMAGVPNIFQAMVERRQAAGDAQLAGHGTRSIACRTPGPHREGASRSVLRFVSVRDGRRIRHEPCGARHRSRPRRRGAGQPPCDISGRGVIAR